MSQFCLETAIENDPFLGRKKRIFYSFLIRLNDQIYILFKTATNLKLFIKFVLNDLTFYCQNHIDKAIIR